MRAGSGRGGGGTWMPGTSPLLSGLILSGGAKGLSTSGFPADRAGRGSDFGTPASRVAVLGLAPPSPTASCPDLFRASTPCGIAVRAGRGRGGGGTWMPGTSPGMTAGGRGWPEDARPARHRPRPWAHSPRRKSKPDSNGTSPGMTAGGRGVPESARPARHRPRPFARSPRRKVAQGRGGRPAVGRGTSFLRPLVRNPTSPTPRLPVLPCRRATGRREGDYGDDRDPCR